VVAAALLFGALHKGATALDLETERVTQELSLILQALIILSVSADGLWTWLKGHGVTRPTHKGLEVTAS
jgi:simple sugar transport system permease protein